MLLQSLRGLVQPGGNQGLGVSSSRNGVSGSRGVFFSRNGVFSSQEGVFGSHKGVSGSHGVLGSRLGVLGSHQFDEAGSEKPMLYNYSWMLLRGRFLSYRWT